MKGIEQFSEAFEAKHNRDEFSQERSAAEKDIDAFLKLKETIEHEASSAETILSEKYPKELDLFHQSEQGDMDASSKIGILKKTKPKAYALIIKVSLRNAFEDLKNYINSYVTKVHESARYAEVHGAETSNEAKTKQSQIETDRSNSHNALIDQLKIIRRNLALGGIDIGFLDVVGFRMDQEYRGEIQRWAQHVADYLVTVSRTTI